MRIESLGSMSDEILDELLAVWEKSVHSSHHFLNENDIEYYRPLVRNEYFQAVDIFVVRDCNGQIDAFMGFSNDMLEMLFVLPEKQGLGYGTALVDYAVNKCGVDKVDVNEDNVKAYRFYLKMGYEVIGRDEYDASGKHFPIIHMRQPIATQHYKIIETERRILRAWQQEDIIPFSEINNDKEVMEYMPKCLSYEETVQFYNRIICEHNKSGYGLYAAEAKNDGKFIGYVGFHYFDFEAVFSPGIEIGWRLARKYWHQGYATEAAKACIDYARKRRLFNEVYSFTAVCNHRSEHVMQKIGMERQGLFSHPSLPEKHKLNLHVLYKYNLLQND